jgi:hypothetical protein
MEPPPGVLVRLVNAVHGVASRKAGTMQWRVKGK